MRLRARHLDPVALTDLADHARRCADGNHAGRDVASHHRSGADHRVIADRHARTDDYPGPEPDVVADCDRLAVLPAGATQVWVDRMRRRAQLDGWPELAVRADPDRRDVEEHAVIVDEGVLPDRDRPAVVAAKRRPDHHLLPDIAEQLAQDPVALLQLGVPG